MIRARTLLDVEHDGVLVVENGDLFDCPAQTIVNPANCVGAMGKGVALHIARRWPGCVQPYRRACADGLLRPGHPWLWRGGAADCPWVLHVPTKAHWRDQSDLTGILDGLSRVALRAGEAGITSVACPALGCGLGGLTWADAQEPLVLALSRWRIPVWLFAPPAQ